jgi:hypothetical protein
MIEKLGEMTFKTNDPINIFDVALSGLDLEQNGSWIMDLGCSYHVSMDPNVFFSLNVQHILVITMVQTSRNQIFPIESKYTINFGSQGEININDVYFVSKFAFNLLSIGSITNMGLILKFNDKKCVVYQGPNKIAGWGICNSKIGLYQYIIIHPRFNICAIPSPFMGHLWHHCLMHLKQHSVRSMGSHHIAKGIPLILGPHDICDKC